MEKKLIKSSKNALASFCAQYESFRQSMYATDDAELIKAYQMNVVSPFERIYLEATAALNELHFAELHNQESK